MSSAETTKIDGQNVICTKCGADIRLGSMFCYACGNDLSVAEPVPAEKAKPKKAKRSKRAAKIETADLKAIPKPEQLDVVAETGNESLVTKVAEKKSEKIESVEVPEKVEVNEPVDIAPMKSAATIRRQNRAKKPAPSIVDVRWLPRSGFDVPFLIGSVVFLIIAGLILAAAVYLK